MAVFLQTPSFAGGGYWLLIVLDEGLLLVLVELGRNDIRLVIFEPQAMQQRDQPRTAFVNEAKFLFDPGTDLARRARQRRADESFQSVFLRGTQKTGAAAHVEAGQPLDPALLKQFVPATDRVVVHQQRSGDVLTAPSTVQQHQGVGPPRHPRRCRAIAHQRDELAAIFFGEESTTNHASSMNPPNRKTQGISPESSMSRGIQH